MLQASGLFYIADPRVGPLFENLSVSLLPGEKVALMGQNGCGKTKLLQILAGLIQPSSGQVVTRRGSKIGYLPQDFDFEFLGTLDEFIDGDPLATKWLGRFGLDEKGDQCFATLSLGERMRAALAQLLAEEPTILLLDEPTNHLDLEARLWLEEFLLDCPQGVLMVCHDRAMVNAVVDRVLYLERAQLTQYAGGYDDMLRQKQEKFERDRTAYERERAESRRLKNAAEQTLQRATRMVDKTRIRDYSSKAAPYYNARAKGVDKRAKAIRTRVSHLMEDATEKPFVGDANKLEFLARPLRSDYPLTVRGLRKAYAEELFGGLNLSLEKGQRLALVGPNGCGKTTLMRILLDEEEADAGDIAWSGDAVIAYLSQSRHMLDSNLPILEALAPETPREEQFVRSLLGRLLLRGEAVHKPVGVLSVGERTKVELVKLLMSPANVLLLDEPTNHLDVDSLEALESALHEFPGSVIFTSHDREFVDRVADDVVTVGSRCG